MKTQVPSAADCEDDSDECDGFPRSEYFCWWRSAAAFRECAKLLDKKKSASSLMVAASGGGVSGSSGRVRVIREMERLALLATEGLDELRHKLYAYRAGDFWVPTGGLSKDEMDIPPVNTILLVGFTGSGKSSLVNLMYSILGRAGLIPFAKTSTGKSSNYTTMYLEEHNVLRSMRSGFCVYDSRGFDYSDLDGALAELSEWMSEGVHHNQLCLRSGDQTPMEDEEAELSFLRSSAKFVKRRVNCVLVVVDVADVYKAIKAGGDPEKLRATKELFSAPALKMCHENPILILTHGDLLSAQERIEVRLKICECLGISEATGVYDIVCLTEHGFLAEEADPVTAYSVAEVVYRALLISDRGHDPKSNLRDGAWLVFSCLMWLVAVAFRFLADVCSKVGQKKRIRIQKKLD